MKPVLVFQGHSRLLAAATFSVILALLLASGVVLGQSDSPQHPTRALTLLEEILERPEFQWDEPQQTLLERAWAWITRQFFTHLPDSAGSAGIATLLLTVAGLTFLLLALFYSGTRLRREFTAGVEPTLDETLATVRDADEAMVTAEKAAEQGDYRLALRYLYLSSLLYLHERGLIDYDKTRTNREYLQSASLQPQLAETLGEIVDVFDRSWYGVQAPDAQTYEQFVGYVYRLRKLR